MSILLGAGRILALILLVLPLLVVLILVPKKFFPLALFLGVMLYAAIGKYPSLGRILMVLIWIAEAVIVLLFLILNHDDKVLRKGSRVPLDELDLWLNAAGSCLSAANGVDAQRLMVQFAGTTGSGLRRMAIRRTLKNYWEITDHDSAVEEMSELLTLGMRAQFHVWMEIQEKQRAVAGPVPDSGLGQPPSSGENKLPSSGSGASLQDRLLDAWHKQGINTLLGWDLGRLACNTQYCYLAGYLSREEMTSLGRVAYELAQEHYSSWEELMESYLLGFQFWCGEDENIPGSQGAKRREVYEKLHRERPSIYEVIPWRISTELS